MIDLTSTYCIKAENGKAVYKVKIDSIELLIFYSVKTGKFHGVFENGTIFTSTDKGLKSKEWFKQLVGFFQNGG